MISEICHSTRVKYTWISCKNRTRLTVSSNAIYGWEESALHGLEEVGVGIAEPLVGNAARIRGEQPLFDAHNIAASF